MITLTTPSEILTVLGSAIKVPYNKVVLAGIKVEPTTNIVRAQVRFSATTDPTGTVIVGNLEINTGTPNSNLTISLPTVDFYRTLAIISDLQNALEAGLVALAVIDGVQSPGV